MVSERAKEGDNLETCRRCTLDFCLLIHPRCVLPTYSWLLCFTLIWKLIQRIPVGNLVNAGKSLVGGELLNQAIPVSLTRARTQKVSSASSTHGEALTHGPTSLLLSNWITAEQPWLLFHFGDYLWSLPKPIGALRWCFPSPKQQMVAKGFFPPWPVFNTKRNFYKIFDGYDRDTLKVSCPFSSQP